MATAYTGMISGHNINTGEAFVQFFTSTDVASSYWLFPNNGSNNFFTAPGKAGSKCVITDISLSNATQTEVVGHLRVSGKDTGVALGVVGLVNTINNRLPQPIPIMGGSSVMMQVKTT
jgi:hypothetical protein